VGSGSFVGIIVDVDVAGNQMIVALAVGVTVAVAVSNTVGSAGPEQPVSNINPSSQPAAGRIT